MIAATPVIGGHYLADLIGGAALAVLTIPTLNGLHRGLLRWMPFDFEHLIPGRKGYTGSPIPQTQT
jgi:membrane-associated phospholipid phosphatase